MGTRGHVNIVCLHLRPYVYPEGINPLSTSLACVLLHDSSLGQTTQLADLTCGHLASPTRVLGQLRTYLRPLEDQPQLMLSCYTHNYVVGAPFIPVVTMDRYFRGMHQHDGRPLGHFLRDPNSVPGSQCSTFTGNLRVIFRMSR